MLARTIGKPHHVLATINSGPSYRFHIMSTNKWISEVLIKFSKFGHQVLRKSLFIQNISNEYVIDFPFAVTQPMDLIIRLFISKSAFIASWYLQCSWHSGKSRRLLDGRSWNQSTPVHNSLRPHSFHPAVSGAWREASGTMHQQKGASFSITITCLRRASLFQSVAQIFKHWTKWHEF